MIHSEWRPQTAADGTAPKTPPVRVWPQPPSRFTADALPDSPISIYSGLTYIRLVQLCITPIEQWNTIAIRYWKYDMDPSTLTLADGHLPAQLCKLIPEYLHTGFYGSWESLDVVSGDSWSYKTCKAPVKLSPPTNQHPILCRLDALPVAQPTASKPLREKCHIPQTCSLQAHLESSNIVSTTKGCWLPWGLVAKPPVVSRGVARNLIWGVYVLTSHCNFKTLC